MEGVKTSQRARLLALLLGILILGVLGQSVVIDSYLLESFRRLEETQVRASARLIRLWLDNFVQPLEATARTVSGWTPPPADWAPRVVAAAQNRGATVDAAVQLRADGSVVRGFGVEAQGAPGPLGDFTARYLQRHASASAAIAGWIATPRGLLATASREASAPAAGTRVVLARYFTTEDLSTLEDLSGTTLALDRATGANPPFVQGSGRGELQRGGKGDRALELCSPLTPALNPGGDLLCVKLRDSIYLRGKAGADDLRLATIGGFVMLILSAWMFLDRALLRRLAHLVREIGAARQGGTEALELALAKDSGARDELAQLSGGMGELLSQVRRVETDLRAQQENFRSLTESTGVAIFVLRDRVVYANPFAELLTGYTHLELLERRLPDLLHRNDRERAEARIGDTLRGAARRNVETDEVRGVRKDGSPYWARVHTVTITYQDAPAVLATLYDTSEQRHLEAVLAREKERLQVILASIGEGIVSLDATGKVNYLNTAAERLIGRAAGVTLGKPLAEIAQFADPKQNRPLPQSVMDQVQSGGVTVAANLLTPFGETRQVEVHASALQSSGEGGERPGSVVVLRDVSEVRRMTQNLEYQASHDELTGLVNRREFNHRLQEALQRCRSTGEPYALCYVDLDQFKTVNDICGHHAGDLLLQQITAGLRQHIRENDTLARLGGDEFGLLLVRCPAEQAVAYANELRGVISEVRFTWSGRVFTVDASVGITMLNHIEGSIDEALSIADATCYVAKEQGRNRVRMYRPGDVDLQRQFGHMRWAQRLKDALDGGQFLLYEQAVTPLAEGRTPAIEVLLRLREADGRIISAGDFLEAAERYQMMPAIDRLVVTGVLDHLKQERAPRHCFVNLSGQSLGDDSFHAFLLDMFAHLPELAKHITFEVTETAIISTLSKAQRIMKLLHDRGCTFALDDFGTGMSSFVYLKELDVQYLKIAGPFVKNMSTSALDEAIVRNFTTFGRQMGLVTIAEWVEDTRTLEMLRDMQVDYAQGYVHGQARPLAATPADAGARAADGRAA